MVSIDKTVQSFSPKQAWIQSRQEVYFYLACDGELKGMIFRDGMDHGYTPSSLLWT